MGDFPAMTSQPPGAEGSWFWMYLPWRHVQGAIHTAFARDGVKSWPKMGEDLGKSWVCPNMGYTPRFRFFFKWDNFQTQPLHEHGNSTKELNWLSRIRNQFTRWWSTNSRGQQSLRFGRDKQQASGSIRQ